MNPELLRNLWLEASPFRLILIAGFLLLAFGASSVGLGGFASISSVALALYWFFAVLWGTRSAALSVVGEIRERTWDSQKLSSIGPWDMVWGKLLGATCANWFGALLCLPTAVLLDGAEPLITLEDSIENADTLDAIRRSWTEGTVHMPRGAEGNTGR